MTKIIKKYKNRRLYDTEKSQYVTLEDLKSYVLDGIPFEVLDSSSGHEITNNILLQILVDQGTATNQFLSPEILKEFIVFADKPMNDDFKNMFEYMLKNMRNMQEQFYFNEFKQKNEEMNQQAQQMFSQWLKLFKK